MHPGEFFSVFSAVNCQGILGEPTVRTKEPKPLTNDLDVDCSELHFRFIITVTHIFPTIIHGYCGNAHHTLRETFALKYLSKRSKVALL